MIVASDVILQSLLNNMPLIFYRIDENDCLVEAEGSGLDTLNLKDETLIGHHVGDFFDAVSQKLDSIRALTRYFTETSHNVQGNIIWFFHYLFAVPDSTIVGIALDVSNVKNSQQLLMQLESENRALARRMLEANENVRLEVARDLHDELGQSLTAIRTLATAMIGSKQEPTPNFLNLAQGIVDISAAAYESTYDLMHSLRPVELDSLGLMQSLESCIKNSGLEGMGVSIQLNVEGEVDNLDSLIQIVTYRLVQEALTNIAKHAMASHVSILLHRKRMQLDDEQLLKYQFAGFSNADGGNIPRECLHIIIEDDGVGFDEREIDQGFGLSGIRERVRALGGKVDITSGNGQGVRVEAQIDIH